MENLIEKIRNWLKNKTNSAIILLDNQKKGFTLVQGSKKALKRLFYTALKMDEENILVDCFVEALQDLEHERSKLCFPVKRNKFNS